MDIEEVDTELNFTNIYEPYNIYQTDELNYNGSEDRIEFLEVEETEEDNLKLDIFK